MPGLCPLPPPPPHGAQEMTTASGIHRRHRRRRLLGNQKARSGRGGGRGRLHVIRRRTNAGCMLDIGPVPRESHSINIALRRFPRVQAIARQVEALDRDQTFSIECLQMNNNTVSNTAHSRPSNSLQHFICIANQRTKIAVIQKVH